VSSLEKEDKTILQRLLFVLLKIISTASQHFALNACDKLLIYLKKIPVIFENFTPNAALLKQLNFQRLLDSNQTEVVYDLMIFILRYYSEVDHTLFELTSKYKETLQKEEKKRIWLTLDHVLIRLDSFLDEFKHRNVSPHYTEHYRKRPSADDGVHGQPEAIYEPKPPGGEGHVTSGPHP